MNWIDILVLVITILIVGSILATFIINKIKHKFHCSSCAAVKRYKKDIKKAQKEINKEKKLNK